MSIPSPAMKLGVPGWRPRWREVAALLPKPAHFSLAACAIQLIERERGESLTGDVMAKSSAGRVGGGARFTSGFGVTSSDSGPDGQLVA